MNIHATLHFKVGRFYDHPDLHGLSAKQYAPKKPAFPSQPFHTKSFPRLASGEAFVL